MRALHERPIGLCHDIRRALAHVSTKSVCEFVSGRLRYLFLHAKIRPLGRARVFACKESLGKSIPAEWCRTPFSNGEQPLAINVVRVSMYFELFFAL